MKGGDEPTKAEILAELGKLAVDLYSEGYHSGWPHDTAGNPWTRAWAEAMYQVAKGWPFAPEMVSKIKQRIDAEGGK